MTSASAPVMKQTPLYHVHRHSGARMVAFSGWEMPAFYSRILEEHQRVRSHAGLFDVSHMGEVEIRGPHAETAVQQLTINDVHTLENYQLQYSALCNESGGLIDDITICRLAADHFLLIVNASNIDKDVAWIVDHLPTGAEAVNNSDAKGLLALQGPDAETILQRLTTAALCSLPYYHATANSVAGHEVLICRTGYTGEDGFELLVNATDAPAVWDAVLDAGKANTILPVGLGARDTLRLEARYLLYGTDMDETCNPFEVGLGWMTKLGKGDFIGREALHRIKEAGVQRRMVGFIMQERGVPRAHYEVKCESNVIGTVTSGTMSPTLNQAVGTAIVATPYAKIGTEFDINIRNKSVRAKTVRAPFVERRVKR